MGRLCAYTLPADWLAAARADWLAAARVAVGCLRPLLAAPELHPAQTLVMLQTVETELREMGGEYDPELAKAIELVDAAFPWVNLVEVATGRPCNDREAAYRLLATKSSPLVLKIGECYIRTREKPGKFATFTAFN